MSTTYAPSVFRASVFGWSRPDWVGVDPLVALRRVPKWLRRFADVGRG